LEWSSEMLINRNDDLFDIEQTFDRETTRTVFSLGRMGTASKGLYCHGGKNLLYR
jgi:hypothetical protein